VQPGSLTPLQLEHLVHFATFQSFEKASKMLLKHHGVYASAATSRRQTESIGACAEQVQNEQAKMAVGEMEQASQKKKPIELVVSNDGAYVSLRGKVWAEVKTMAIGQVQKNVRPCKQRPNQEVKLVNVSYVSRLTDAATFTELIIGELHRRGFFDAERVAALQDGAEWIQSLIDALRADMTRILDFYHAGQYLSDIAALVGQAGTQLPANWWEEQLHELKHQGPEHVLQEVLELLKDHAQVEDLAQKVNYLQKREAMMDYPQFRAQGWPVGSGSVESANLGVVQARLKGVGMHWQRHNVNPMLALRTAECNDRWDETRDLSFRQRLSTRSQKRLAHQQARFAQLEQTLLNSLLRLFLLASPLKPKQIQEPLSSTQADTASSTSLAAAIPQTHPWRQYHRAKK
jgi:hypothetical protein